jgi:hypothetical protein
MAFPPIGWPYGESDMASDFTASFDQYVPDINVPDKPISID